MALNSEVRATLFRAMRRNQKASGLESALNVGGAILDGWFDGDLEAWRSGQGDVTLRALARDPAVGLSSSTLYRYVAITTLCRKMDRTHFAHLGTSHLRQVLPLPMTDQIDLVTRAEEGRWTVQRLMHEVRRRVDRGVPTRGRRKNTTWTDALVHLRAWVAHPGHVDGLDGVDELSPESASRTLRLLQQARRDLERIESLLLDATNRRREDPD
jgi:hypothetical protein